MGMLNVSVIIPAYRDPGRLKLCLEALTTQSIGKGNYEVIVVNNEPAKPIDFDDYPDSFRLLEQPIPGSYAARNKGVRAARGKVLAFTDADCIPDYNWLKQGVKELNVRGLDRLAGHIEMFYEARKQTAIDYYDYAFAFPQKKYVMDGVCVTANLFVRASMFDDVGLFEESAYSGGDTEWNTRASNAGYTIGYSQNSIVKHPCRHSWGALKSKLRRVIGGRWTRDKNYSLPFFNSVLPPIGAINSIMRSPLDQPYQMLKVYMVVYYVKAYSYFSLMKLKLKLAQPER